MRPTIYRAVAAIALAALCWSAPAAEPAAEPVLGFIKPAKDSPTFIDTATGRRFTPIGMNYTPHGVQTRERGATRLNWIRFDENVTERDCARMAAAGVNVIRVFLSARSFLPEPGVIPEESLKKTDALVRIAKRHGQRVIFGGPDWWEGPTPLWQAGQFDRAGLWGKPQLDHLAKFWSAFAARYRDEPGVFSYSLRNEPQVPRTIPEEVWHDFLQRKYGTPQAAGKAWGQTINTWAECGRPPDQDKEGDQWLYDYQLAREFVAYRWARVQTDAIRAADPNHMVTNGGIQWDVPLWRNFPPSPYGYDGFAPRNFARLFDYLSVHWYDIKPDHLRDARSYQTVGEPYFDAFLTYCRFANKPLVLEEFPNIVLTEPAYASSFYRHVTGALIWEYLNNSTPEGGLNPGVADMLLTAKAKLAAVNPVSLDGPDVLVWKIDRKRLLTWYADPSTFRKNPAWLQRTGKDAWHDTGGYWIAHFGELRKGGRQLVRIEIEGEGEEFFEEMYRK